MFLSYLKIALRFFRKNKVNTLINLLGLALALSVSMLISNYVYQQFQFDKFHVNRDRMYRLLIKGSMADGKELDAAVTSGNISETILNKVPEIDISCRVYQWGSSDVIACEKRYTTDVVLYADSGFFRMFSFPLVQANPDNMLNEQFQVVLSRETAMKYFGSEDVVGKTIEIDQSDYKIIAIMDDVPENSHMQFDMVASFITLIRPDYDVVKNNGISFPTYFMAKENSVPEVFIPKVIAAADERAAERFGPYGIKIKHSAQDFNDIYLHSEGLDFRNNRYGDLRNIYVFSFLAFFIIFIAVINYVNLMTAQSEKRLREIGLRKVVGAARWNLITQFVGESIMITLVAFILALTLNELLLPPFSELMGQKLALFYWSNPLILLLILLFVLILGVISGIYPALVLSSFRPALILKGTQFSSRNPNILRKILVSLQFSISIFLIITLMLMHKQIVFAKDKDLGFEKENLLVLNGLTPKLRREAKTIKGELLQYSKIESVAATQSAPGGNNSLQNCYLDGADPKTGVMMYECRVQDDFVETMGMQIIEGRDFISDMKSDSAAVILNETAVRKMGFTGNPIGQKIVVWQNPVTVIGVVSDYNYASIHSEIDPIALTHYARWFRIIVVRIQPGEIKTTLAFIEKTLTDIDPSYSFDYEFIDQRFAEMYRQEERVSDMITAAALLAIIISMLGVFALTAFTVRQKIKEIGIRKAIGASTFSVVHMLMRDLSRWIIAGNLLAWPLAFYTISKWLDNFAFHISIVDNWWIFVMGAFVAMVVGSVAMLYQALRAANANPIDALRYE